MREVLLALMTMIVLSAPVSAGQESDFVQANSIKKVGLLLNLPVSKTPNFTPVQASGCSSGTGCSRACPSGTSCSCWSDGPSCGCSDCR
jgi:hypothetical protein